MVDIIFHVTLSKFQFIRMLANMLWKSWDVCWGTKTFIRCAACFEIIVPQFLYVENFLGHKSPTNKSDLILQYFHHSATNVIMNEGRRICFRHKNTYVEAWNSPWCELGSIMLCPTNTINASNALERHWSNKNMVECDKQKIKLHPIPALFLPVSLLFLQ